MEAALPSPSTLGKDGFENGSGGTNLGARPLLIQSSSVLGGGSASGGGRGRGRAEEEGKVLRRRIENPTGKLRNL